MSASGKSKWDNHYEPLVNYLLSSDEVKIRPAIEVGQKAVDFCRAGDLVKWIHKHEDILRNKFPQCFENPSVPISQRNAELLIERLCQLSFLYRAQYKPIATKVTDGNTSQESIDKSALGDKCDKERWPKRLERTRDQKYSSDAYYVIEYDPKDIRNYVYLCLIIGAVLAVCLFPAWPLAFKLFTWYISVVFMTFLLISVILRLICFLFLWFFGIDFWIFPNLFDEEKGVIDSFKPFLAFEKRDDDLGMLIARGFLAILLAGASYQLTQTHSLSDVHKFATQQFLDVLDWGHQKLAAAPADSSVLVAKFAPASPSDPTDGYRCMEPCGFESYEALKDECLFDCNCMREVLDSHCFKKCTKAAKLSLEESKIEACRTDITVDNDDAELAEDENDEL